MELKELCNNDGKLNVEMKESSYLPRKNIKLDAE